MNISLEKSIAAHFFDISKRPYNANNKICEQSQPKMVHNDTDNATAQCQRLICALFGPVSLVIWWYGGRLTEWLLIFCHLCRHRHRQKLHSIGKKNVLPNCTMLHILLSHSFLPLNLGNNEIADNWTCHLRRYLCLLRRIWIIIGWCFNSANIW